MSTNPAIRGDVPPVWALQAPEKELAWNARWLALYTFARHEKAVASYLEHCGIEHYLPVVKVRRRWRNRLRVEVEEPLFHSYIFARIPTRLCWKAESAPGVVRAVRVGTDPAIVEDSEIQTLREGLAVRNGQPHPYLIVGKKARIVCGAFVGQQGILVRKEPNLRVVLSMQNLPISFSIEVDGNEVEMIA